MHVESTITGNTVYRGIRSVLFPNADDSLTKPQQLERSMLLILLPLFGVACIIIYFSSIALGVDTWFERYQLLPTAVVFFGLMFWAIKTRPNRIKRIRTATLIVGPGIVMERLAVGLWIIFMDGYSPATLGAIAVWLILSACLYVFLIPGRKSLLYGFGYYLVAAALVVTFLIFNTHEIPPFLADELIISILVATPTFLMLTAGFTHLRANYANALTRNQDLESLAMQDGLTGLFNRRAFAAFMRRARSRQVRKKTPVSIAILDIDYFKRVNDTFGHQKGDEVLVQIADVLTKTMRRTDDLIRWGGEEFVILMEETPLREAGLVADRIREIIQNTDILRERPITVSIGVTELVAGEDDSEFFGRADAALYDAKDSGRNRVVVRKRPARPSDPKVKAIADILESEQP